MSIKSFIEWTKKYVRPTREIKHESGRSYVVEYDVYPLGTIKKKLDSLEKRVADLEKYRV